MRMTMGTASAPVRSIVGRRSFQLPVFGSFRRPRTASTTAPKKARMPFTEMKNSVVVRPIWVSVPSCFFFRRRTGWMSPR